MFIVGNIGRNRMVVVFTSTSVIMTANVGSPRRVVLDTTVCDSLSVTEHFSNYFGFNHRKYKMLKRH